MRRKFMLLAAAGALALGGCQQMSEMMGGGATKMNANLSGQNEVPPVQTQGRGSADVSYDKSSRMLKWKVDYSGLSANPVAAHFHGPAAPGSNAGVVVNIAPGGVRNPIEGQATITEQQAQDLLAGRWYINVHTPQNPNGEIRGQVVPAR